MFTRYIITHKRDSQSVAPSRQGAPSAAVSFQTYGTSLMSSDLDESLLGDKVIRSDESLNSEALFTEETVVVVPNFILKIVKWSRFDSSPSFSKA